MFRFEKDGGIWNVGLQVSEIPSFPAAVPAGARRTSEVIQSKSRLCFQYPLGKLGRKIALPGRTVVARHGSWRGRNEASSFSPGSVDPELAGQNRFTKDSWAVT